MRRTLALLLLACLSATAPVVHAAVLAVGREAQTDVMVTVYNGNLGQSHVSVGQKVDIIRGEEVKFANSGWSGATGVAAFALNTLTLLSALAGALWMYICAEQNLKHEDQEGGASGSSGSGSSTSHSATTTTPGGSGGTNGSSSRAL